ncbi:MAG TPA: hypothetical protein VKT77_02785, partial [Chthonomonadaceae bacterium]|nr:hypothetical protein [Chthonomonadaceae bacterium]
PICHFDSPPIVNAAYRGDRKMVDTLLEFGADINARSTWWAGGFGVLPHRDPEFARYLVSRGANVDVWAAAGLNDLDRLRELIAANPACVNARGGDGQGPLQFAASVEAAKVLLDAGAEIDMRDLDHESTAAQRMAVDRPDVCRYLLSRGAKLDIFMAVQLGDLALVKRALAADPESRSARVGTGEFVTKDSTGGHIYIYLLKTGDSPLFLAAELGHKEIYDYLLSLCTPVERLLAACWTADETAARAVLAKAPDLVRALPPDKMRLIADAAWAHKTEAVRLMLKLGFDADARGDHESTPLNRACVRGYADLVELLLDAGASMEMRNEFGGRPLPACLWGADNFRDPSGDYVRSVERLLAASPPLADVRVGVANRPVAAAVRRCLEPLAKTNLIAAIKLGKLPSVRSILDRDPELLNARTGGALPIFEAVRSNQPEVLAYLLERGANTSLHEWEGGKGIVDYAVDCERPAIAEQLRAHLTKDTA